MVWFKYAMRRKLTRYFTEYLVIPDVIISGQLKCRIRDSL
jgi:hypothetical protein